MSTHTPGPWTLDAGKHRMWICRVGNNDDDPEVWSAHENPIGVPWPFGDKIADAHLIAAAPDMLAALKVVGAALSEKFIKSNRAREADDAQWAAYSQVIAAIAKAEGKP